MATATAAIPDAGHIVAPDALAPRGFVQLPRAVLFHPDLSDGAKVLFGALLHYAWQEGSCFPGQARLADDLGVTERTIRNRIRELEAAGVLRVKQRGLGKTNLYLLLCSGEPEGGERSGPSSAARNQDSAKTGNQIPVSLVEQEPAVRLEPEPPPPPRKTTDQADEEGTSSCDPDGADTDDLVAAGATEAQASELTALGATPEQVQTVLTDAWRQTGAMARERELRCPDRYRQACVRNGTEALLWRLRDEPEHAPADEVGERLAAAEQAEHEHWRDLRRRFDELPEPERRRLIEQARASNRILSQRPPEHPLVLGAAIALLAQSPNGATI